MPACSQNASFQNTEFKCRYCIISRHFSKHVRFCMTVLCFNRHAQSKERQVLSQTHFCPTSVMRWRSSRKRCQRTAQPLRLQSAVCTHVSSDDINTGTSPTSGGAVKVVCPHPRPFSAHFLYGGGVLMPVHHPSDSSPLTHKNNNDGLCSCRRSTSSTVPE